MGETSPERRNQTREGMLARLHLAWRIKRLLIEQHNRILPGLEPPRREAFRRDWMRRDRENHDEINTLLNKTYRADHPGRLHPGPLPWLKEKLAGETDGRRDAELLARPRLQPPDDLASVESVDPLEDFTSYTEQDPNGDVSVAENEVSFTDLEARGSDTWVYDDKGVGHFDGFEHQLDFETTAHTTSPKVSIHFVWALSNVVEDGRYWDVNSSQAVGTDWHATDGLKLWCPENGNIDQYGSVSLNTRYYLTLSRDAGATSLVEYIYDDADRTNLLDSLSVSVPASRTYRHVFALNTYNLGDSGITASGDVRNLDLGEAAAGRPAPLLGPLGGRGQIGPTLAR